MEKTARVTVVLQISHESYEKISMCASRCDLSVPLWCRCELSKIADLEYEKRAGKTVSTDIIKQEKLSLQKQRFAEAQTAREAREKRRLEAAEEARKAREIREQRRALVDRKRVIKEIEIERKALTAIIVREVEKRYLAEVFTDDETLTAQPRVNMFLFVETPTPTDALATPEDTKLFGDTLYHLKAIENPEWFGIVARYYGAKVKTQQEAPGVSLLERYKEIFKPRYILIYDHENRDYETLETPVVKILARRWNPQFEKFLDINNNWEIFPRNRETNRLLTGDKLLEEVRAHNAQASNWSDDELLRRKDINNNQLKSQPWFDEPPEGWEEERHIQGAN